MAKSTTETRALIADPSPHMTDLVALMLRSLGIRSVDSVRTLADAAARLAVPRYGVMLLDADLGIADNIGALRTLRQTVGRPARRRHSRSSARRRRRRVPAQAVLGRTHQAAARRHPLRQPPVRRNRSLQRPRPAPPHGPRRQAPPRLRYAGQAVRLSRR